MTFTRPESIRSKYEDRDKGEVRPESVEQAIRLAHGCRATCHHKAVTA